MQLTALRDRHGTCVNWWATLQLGSSLHSIELFVGAEIRVHHTLLDKLLDVLIVYVRPLGLAVGAMRPANVWT